MRWFEPFIGAGAGINKSTLEVPARAFGFVPGSTEHDSSISPALQILVGANFNLGEKWALGTVYRRVEVAGDVETPPYESIDSDGEAVSLDLKYSFSF
jgi:opacity protein-like surface antigen